MSAYSDPVPKPGNRASIVKMLWVAWLVLLSLSSVWLLQAH